MLGTNPSCFSLLLISLLGHLYPVIHRDTPVSRYRAFERLGQPLLLSLLVSLTPAFGNKS